MARKPFADRLVIVGDAICTRLYKDGKGSSCMTSKSAVHTALLYRVEKEDFREHYLPVCKTLNRDNLFERSLFFANDLISVIPSISRLQLYYNIVGTGRFPEKYICSDIFWDMFTGSRFYKDIFIRVFNLWLAVHALGVIVASFFIKMSFSMSGKNRKV
ncbi:MAG: hypothetical protein HRF42_04880 [Candidatus Brocadia sp.]|jgi:hypothetical protein